MQSAHLILLLSLIFYVSGSAPIRNEEISLDDLRASNLLQQEIYKTQPVLARAFDLYALNVHDPGDEREFTFRIDFAPLLKPEHFEKFQDNPSLSYKQYVQNRKSLVQRYCLEAIPSLSTVEKKAKASDALVGTYGYDLWPRSSMDVMSAHEENQYKDVRFREMKSWEMESILREDITWMESGLKSIIRNDRDVNLSPAVVEHIYRTNPAMPEFNDTIFSDKYILWDFKRGASWEATGCEEHENSSSIVFQGTIPPYLRNETGLIYEAFYPADVVSQDTYIRIDGPKYFWVPMETRALEDAIVLDEEFKKCKKVAYGSFQCDHSVLKANAQCNPFKENFRCRTIIKEIEKHDGTHIEAFYFNQLFVSTLQSSYELINDAGQKEQFDVKNRTTVHLIPDSWSIHVGKQVGTGKHVSHLFARLFTRFSAQFAGLNQIEWSADTVGRIETLREIAVRAKRSEARLEQNFVRSNGRLVATYPSVLTLETVVVLLIVVILVIFALALGMGGFQAILSCCGVICKRKQVVS